MRVLGLLIFMILSNKAFTYFLFRIIVLSILAFGFSGFFVSASQAAKLGKEDCKALSEQLKELKKHPAVKNMAKGFEWIKANMEPEDLAPIKTYLEVDEQVKFRCPKKRKPKAKTVKAKPGVKQKAVSSKDPAKKNKKKKPVRKKTKKVNKKQVKKTSNVGSGNFLEEFFNSDPPPAPKKK